MNLLNITLRLSLLSVFVLGGCTSLNKSIKQIPIQEEPQAVAPSSKEKKEPQAVAPSSKEKKEPQAVAPSSKEKEDPIFEIIKGIKKSPSPFDIELVGYVDTELLSVYPSPKSQTVINHITRGTKILIFDYKDGWASISADSEYPYWVNLKNVCFTEQCWVKKAHEVKQKIELPNAVIVPKVENSSRKTKEQVNTYRQSSIQKQVSTTSSRQGYRNVQGNYIQSPTRSNKKPRGATARCGDGTWSFSQNTRGTCSGHGGVASWL
ncbi:DUF3761 domain-containing protein [Acinetobacter baumannii]|uniref:DUF3761 domain-containing protein n=3 Tax=Acinetobacter baumannii TaxID=470 RepID=UPI003AF9159D